MDGLKINIQEEMKIRRTEEDMLREIRNDGAAFLVGQSEDYNDLQIRSPSPDSTPRYVKSLFQCSFIFFSNE